MSCEKNSARAGQTATKNGISKNGAKSSFVAGSTPQASYFVAAKPADKKEKVSRKKRPQGRASGKKKAFSKNGQVAQKLFFELARQQKTAVPGQKKEDKKEGKPLPTQRHIHVVKDFTPAELQTISIQLRLGTADISRRLREAGFGISRGIGHGDPRPLDWVESDRKNFQFLVAQLTEARRGRGTLDLSALNKSGVVDLWEFCRFEADRANRNIDHLGVPGGSIGGPTAAYLMGNHKLEARFFSHVAAHIEKMVPAEELDEDIGQAGEVD
jgi:hypothetical protein